MPVAFPSETACRSIRPGNGLFKETDVVHRQSEWRRHPTIFGEPHLPCASQLTLQQSCAVHLGMLPGAREPLDATRRGNCVSPTIALDLSTDGPRGTKQTCTNETCGRRFYDLNQVSPTCPYCQTRCDVGAAERHEFQMAVRPKKGKVYRLETLAVSSPQDEETEQEPPAKDDEPVSPPDVLMDVEDEDGAAPDEILGREKPDGEAS